MYAHRGLGLPLPLLVSAGSTVGSVIGSIFPGGHYTGPKFVPDGVVNWAQAGHWDYIRQVATTGHGPHWSQPDKYPGGVNYDLASPGDVGGYGTIPGNIPLGQWLNLFLATYAPGAATATGPASQPVAFNPTGVPSTYTVSAGGPSAAPQAAGIGSPLLIGAAVLAAVIYATSGRPKRRRSNPRRRSARRRR